MTADRKIELSLKFNELFSKLDKPDQDKVMYRMAVLKQQEEQRAREARNEFKIIGRK